MTAVTVVAVGIALVFFTAVAFAPGQRAGQTPIFTFSAPVRPSMAHPTFNTQPVPDRTLVLPEDDAVTTFRITSLGQTGLINNESVATSYRLRATGDLVTVAPLPPNEVLPYSSPRVIDPPLRIRGRGAPERGPPLSAPPLHGPAAADPRPCRPGHDHRQRHDRGPLVGERRGVRDVLTYAEHRATVGS